MPHGVTQGTITDEEPDMAGFFVNNPTDGLVSLQSGNAFGVAARAAAEDATVCKDRAEPSDEDSADFDQEGDDLRLQMPRR